MKEVAGFGPAGSAFAGARECVVSSVLLQGRGSVLFAWHDDATAEWHFHQGGPVDPADRVTVALEVITDMDPTLSEVADLELGTYAERGKVGEPWRRRRKPIDELD